MNAIEALVEKLTPAQRELLARLLAPAKTSEREPIAVIGMACRFPGESSSPAAFREFLLRGGDGITEIPAERFRAEDFYDPRPGIPGKMTSKWGGFLDDVDRFDARFFGVAPREAADMDPQQRLLLEIAHEALDDAGLVASALAGSATGVFVGTHSHDYSWLSFRDPETVHSYLSTGTANSIVANRLSYLLDLKGPSLAVDTACSSSLVALHLACRSLASGDCRIALAAGVNVILSPHWSVAVSQLGMLAPDGRCRPFDAAGRGFVRSEGCGVVALKRLSDAKADGDRIYAVVRGSFVNQDGRTNGITAPSGHSQQAVVREALADAGVTPQAIGYVEAHGTGTSLGDPIEVEALAAVLGGRAGADIPCVLGSVKGNVGHLEAAAGIAGFIKVVLALESEKIPPQLHFERLNPEIDLSGTRFVIPKETVAWPRGGGVPRLAGVSSFGFGGTNAHVVVEEAPAGSAESKETGREAKSHLLVVSARSEHGLRELAESYARHLRASSSPLEDVGFTAGARRTHHEHRLAVFGAGKSELAERLDAFVSRATLEGAFHGVVREKRQSPVFVFSGQGPQWWGMGRELARAEPVFRRSLERCDAILSGHAKWSLFEELGSPESITRIAETEIAQPALFALQVALAELLRSWGIAPGAVVGHSLGEIAAAHVAEILTLEEAVGLVFQRGRLMQAASGKGKMASVELPLEDLESRLAGFEGSVVVAATNGPRTTVVSGDGASIDGLLRSLEGQSVSARLLPVDYAFHSPQMDPIARELEALLEGLAPRPAKVPFVSTVAGKAASGSSLTPSYWKDNVRKPVRFREAVASLIGSGHRVFVEIGPHPVLSSSIAAELEAHSAGNESRVLPSLRRGRDENRAMLELLAALHVSGIGPDFGALYPAPRRVVSLPAYPFQRERFPVAVEKTAMTLPGSRVRAPFPVFECRLDGGARSLFSEHRYQGRALVPGAAYLSMAVEAAHRLAPGSRGNVIVESLEILRPLFLSAESDTTVQWVGGNPDDGFRIFSAASGSPEAWELHASGRARFAPADSSAPSLDLVAIRGHLDPVSAVELYRTAASRGVSFGSRFRGVAEIHRRAGEVLAAVEPPSELASEPPYRIHPAVLDACFQPLHYAVDSEAPLYLPVALDRFVLRPSEAKRLWSHGRLRAASSGREVLTFDVRVADESGNLVAEIDGLRMKQAGDSKSREAALYDVRWRPCDLPRPSPSPEAQWLLVGDEDAVASSLEAVLRERGETVRRIRAAEAGHAIASARARRIGIVYLGGVATKETDDPVEALEPVATSLLDVVRALAEKPELEARLFLVTRGSQPVAGKTEPLRLSGSMLWGLAATLALENPELRPVRIDLDPKSSAGEARELAALLSFDIEDDRIGLRAGRAFVARLAALEPVPPSYRLTPPTGGALESLHLETFPRVRPGRGEVEIEVASTGLNFRDVLMALDLYPGPAGLPGNECAGRIAAVGEGVEGFAEGDAVVGALVPGSFASHVCAPAGRVVALPRGLSFQEGAASPIAFLTARYGLETLARLEPGERVLIHAAAGGVGMAAIQIARLLSAEVVATAGSAAKRDRLRFLGIDEVFDSRDPSFDTGTLRGPVDVVLNSLSGEFIPKSLSLLTPGGRFVEIGKRGIWTEPEVRAFRPDVRYFAFDLEEVFRREPELMRSILAGLFRDLDSGRLAPLPVAAFSIGNAVDAFRTMAEGRHVGKIVLDRLGAGVRIEPEARYLVTGGLGAVGLAAARWLASKGARHLVLASRRPASAEAEQAIDLLRREGVELAVLAADVTREEDVRHLVARASKGRALKGVVHAAGVLDDGIFLRQSWAKLHAALAPKVKGALHLHRATSTEPLDFFVSLSSMASVMGSAGQAGYAAANAFLDALAHERRARGLPGTSVSFGPFEGAGMAAGLDGRDRYREQGIRKMQAGEGLVLLDRLLGGGPAHALALAVDWRSHVRTLPEGSGASLYRELAPTPRKEAPSSPSVETAASRIRSLPAPQRRMELETRVRRHVLAVLGLPETGPLDPHQGFRDAGLDSLMAVEARNRIRTDFPDLALASTLCFDYPNVAALTEFLMKALALEPAPARREPDSVESRIEDLSEAEAEALLLEELEGRRS